MKIGIDLGGSHIGIGVIDDYGNIVEKQEIDLSKQNNKQLEKIMEEYIKKAVQEFLNKYTPIELIGVAAPGTPKERKNYFYCKFRNYII